MTQAYDVVLIGAGPTAYAALGALAGSDKTVAVVTGAPEAAAAAGLEAGLHPKIQSVAFERRHPPGVAERIPVDPAGQVYASAEAGGLANYWGQQLVFYDAGDLQGLDPALTDLKAYRGHAQAALEGLRVTGGDVGGALLAGDGSMMLNRPRLLTGTQDMPEAGLAAMAQAVQARLSAMPPQHVFHLRAQHVTRDTEDQVRIRLSDGSDLRARHVLLAAGVLGTAGIVIRSLPGLARARFQDHAPYMLYTLGLGRVLPPGTPETPNHFNALSMTQSVDGACGMFASVYRMSRAPVSLVTATLGVGPRLRGWLLPRGVDLIRPVQVWTPSSVAHLSYQPAQDRIMGMAGPDPDADPVLAQFRSDLRGARVRSHLGMTAPGQGFHYHGLSLGASDQSLQPVDRVLKDAFGACLTCLDASSLTRIGCQPHTLTAMAQAHARTQQIMGMVS